MPLASMSLIPNAIRCTSPVVRFNCGQRSFKSWIISSRTAIASSPSRNWRRTCGRTHLSVMRCWRTRFERFEKHWATTRRRSAILRPGAVMATTSWPTSQAERNLTRLNRHRARFSPRLPWNATPHRVPYRYQRGISYLLSRGILPAVPLSLRNSSMPSKGDRPRSRASVAWGELAKPPWRSNWLNNCCPIIPMRSFISTSKG